MELTYNQASYQLDVGSVIEVVLEKPKGFSVIYRKVKHNGHWQWCVYNARTKEFEWADAVESYFNKCRSAKYYLVEDPCNVKETEVPENEQFLKTENLTVEEARIALAKGYVVQAEDDKEQWKWDNGGIKYRSSLSEEFETGEWAGPGGGGFMYKIVLEDPKPTKTKLTYDEALQALENRKPVKIQFPFRYTPSLLKPTSFGPLLVSVDALMKLDLADRKGYEIWTEES